MTTFSPILGMNFTGSQDDFIPQEGPEQFLDEVGTPKITGSEVTGEGWVTIYHALDGRAAVVNRWQLSPEGGNLLVRVFGADPNLPPGMEGKRVWSTGPIEGKTPWEGNIQCGLFPGTADCTHCHKPHPANEAFVEFYREWGLQPCRSAHLASPYEAQRHMQLRHKSAWEQIKLHKEERQREEDRELQREMLRTLTRNVGTQELSEVKKK